jgi:hypothetical protein
VESVAHTSHPWLKPWQKKTHRVLVLSRGDQQQRVELPSRREDADKVVAFVSRFHPVESRNE